MAVIRVSPIHKRSPVARNNRPTPVVAADGFNDINFAFILVIMVNNLIGVSRSNDEPLDNDKYGT
jgi:hypothetical protein